MREQALHSLNRTEGSCGISSLYSYLLGFLLIRQYLDRLNIVVLFIGVNTKEDFKDVCAFYKELCKHF